MAEDGSIVIKTDIDDKQAQSELKSLEKKIDSLNEKIGAKKQAQMPLVEQAKEAGAALDAAKAKLADMESGTSFYYTKSQIKDQQSTVAALERQFTGINDKVDKMGASIKADTARLEKMSERAGELSGQLAGAGKSTGVLSKASAAASKHMEKMGRHIATLARRVLVFSLITRALRAIKDYMWSAIKTNDEAVAAVARLKGALMTLAQPIVEVIIPAFTLLINVITRIVNAIARLLSMLFGTTLSKSAQSAKALYNQQKAIEGVGDAAKEASGSLADFDELTTISNDKPSSSSGTGDIDAGGIAPDFTGAINDQLSAIVELFTGAALLALGASLTFSGANIPLGLALMALGAIAIWDAVSENWDEIRKALQGSLGKIVALVSGALLAIGAILVFSGAHIPLGLGLMIAGAIGLASTVAANWGSITSYIKDNINTISLYVAGGLLALGAILTFLGHPAIGIAILAAGAIALGFGIGFNITAIQEALQGPIGLVTALVSGSLLAIGAILTFTGHFAIGIGLLAAGAIGLAATVKANWNSIIEALQGPIGLVTALVSGALLVLGVVLCFTGVGIPLGLGLILAGAAGLAAAIAPNWDFILEKLQGAWANIKNWWDTKIAKFFTFAFWKQKFSAIGESLVSTVKNAVNAGISLFNRFINWINSKLVISWPSIPFLGISAGSYQLLRIPNIPLLAQGAVIPPNREFLAVLGDQKHGTNIEAPLDTIQQAAAQAFAEMGPQFARAIISELVATGIIGNIRAIEDYSRTTAQKEFSLGKPSSAVGRWVIQSMDAYDAVRG